ncbi:MAG: hypothetical protein A2Y48_04325 [Nitrospirae bacterium RIFCSPLOW2_12_42_9]|nr:MAG: hypothetical protein A2Y48_04325 [Nitrospirae bacterium RIFCSPLOW2_12_42_9]
MALFLEFVKHNTILSLTEDSVAISSALYTSLRKKGKLIDDIDILIAGVALSNNLALVTNNEGHFKNIKGLKILNWNKRETTLP